MEYSSTLVGVAISVAANSIVALGLNVLKLAHIRLQLAESPEQRSLLHHHHSPPSTKRGAKRKPRPRTDKAFLRDGIWWAGQSCMLLGEFGNFLAYAFAPASLIAPLGSTALLANAFISPLLLRERFRSADLLGILFVALGSITVVYSSPGKEVVLSPEEVERAVRSGGFLVYCVVCAIGMGALGWASRTRWADEFVLVDVGLSAIAGGFTVLSTKAFSSFLNRLFLKTFRHWITYPILFVLVVSALVQVNFINKALQRFDSRVVVPTQFLTFTLSVIIGSAILYREFDNVPTNSFINFIFGLALSVLGVSVLTRQMAVVELEDEGIVAGLFGVQEEEEAEGRGSGGRRAGWGIDTPAENYPTTSAIFLSPSSTSIPLPLPLVNQSSTPPSTSHPVTTTTTTSSHPSTVAVNEDEEDETTPTPTPTKIPAKNRNMLSSPESRRLRHLRSLPSIRNHHHSYGLIGGVVGGVGGFGGGAGGGSGGGGGGSGRARTVSSVTLGGPIYLFAGVSPGSARTWGGGATRSRVEPQESEDDDDDDDGEGEGRGRTGAGI